MWGTIRFNFGPIPFSDLHQWPLYCLQNTIPVLFADDTNLVSSGLDAIGIQDGVNHDLAIITEWLKANKLSLNIKDTLHVFSSKKQSKSLYVVFRITDWTCCHGPHLHAILRIISSGVSGLATDSPCGVWARGWTTCLLHDSPLFGSHFKMRVGM